MQAYESDVAYWEIHGALETVLKRPASRDIVVLSNITRGEQTSPGAQGATIRYVARGVENYRIGGRSCRLETGQVMIAPHWLGAEAEIRQVDRAGTLGICTLVRGTLEQFAWLQGPLVLSPRDSALLTLMTESARDLHCGQRPKLRTAETLIAGLRHELPAVAGAILDQAAAVTGKKSATRFEMVRRANLAKAYLDANTGRQVDLEEVALAAGMSSFRLLAAFRQCFRQTPADYHRQLRLRLALDEVRRRGVPIAAVADEYGFADASSFSHAYRRAFGQAPVWSKAKAA